MNINKKEQKRDHKGPILSMSVTRYTYTHTHSLFLFKKMLKEKCCMYKAKKRVIIIFFLNFMYIIHHIHTHIQVIHVYPVVYIR